MATRRNSLKGHSPITRAFVVLTVVAFILLFAFAAVSIAIQWRDGVPASPVVWIAAISYFGFGAVRASFRLFGDIGELS